MKTRRPAPKLCIARETVRKLTPDELRLAAGGRLRITSVNTRP